MYLWGNNFGGHPWKIGVADPEDPENIAAWFHISDASVVTSGSYENYIEFGGVKYSHIIDPRTGWPVSEVKSVTVIAPKAELADALATALFIMGPDAGINLIEQLDGVECLYIDNENKLRSSSNLQSGTPGINDPDFKTGVK